ncbi:MAG: NACHT domain-containing protein, partial [Bacteroidales bacterium]|nr:NACHT domain-containing protein [Bacteroidales bacterium]
MKNQANWQKIKNSLKETFIEPDFKIYKTTAFSGVDFDKGLEIFRYILEQKLPNHDETKSVFEKLELYASGQQNKDILEELIGKYEPFLKKLFDINNSPFPAGKALGWGYNKLFDKLSIIASNRSVPTIRNNFYDTQTSGGVEKPVFLSPHFNNLLTDNTNFGKSLHSSYHLRNSNIHNDPHINNRIISEKIADAINSYLYFTFKYYNELCAIIPQNELQPPSTLTIKDLASLSGGAYNPDIDNEVNRGNIIQTIENKIKDFDVLFIEGEEGIGKTTILHQFIAKYPNNCISYFIDDKDSSTYSNTSILKALCNQIHFANKDSELELEVNVSHFSNEDWLNKYLDSESIRSRKNQTFYLIIDGLDEISQDRQTEIKEKILDKLHYDKANIKLLLSGQQNKNLLKKGCQHDKYEIPFLSTDESLKIFGNGITSEQFEVVNKVCRNNAGKIAFLRDLIKKGGISLDNITDKLTNDLRSIYQYVWNSTPDIDENCKIILAIIAFDDEKYNTKDIARIIGISERKIIDSLRLIPFVKKNAWGKYEFIFDGFNDFSRIQLGSYEKKIDKIVIEYLLRDLDSVDSLVRLPEKYKKTGQKDDLIKLLTDKRWRQLLEASEKISVLSRVSNVALDVIQEENENKYIPTILKYSVLKSSLKELSRTSVWQYEIAASLVLEDYMEARNLANLAFLKEDKLKMFASIARAYVERKETVPNDIHKNIQELYNDIDSSKDFKNIKESAVEIASLLMYSNPKLAFRLIEDLSGNISDNDNAFDWALAQISLSVHSNLENIDDVTKEDVNTKVYSKIRNPKIREFADAILYLTENQTCVQLIDKIGQLESTSQKMFLIRNWIGSNQKDDNVAKVIELGLKLVVDKSDKYVPKSGDYKIFAMPLPYLKEKDKAFELIGKIEKYIASIEANSSTNDLLAIKLFIARTLCNFDFDKGENKLFEIYAEIEKISDLAIRCTCFAIYANEATRIINIHQDQNLDLYLETAKNGINNNIDKILEQTASHFEIVQSIITSLVRLYPDNAIVICRKLNKSIDRDNAFLEALTTYLKQSIEKIDTNIIDILLDSVVDIDIYKFAISEVINRLEVVRGKEKISILNYFKYFDMVDALFDNRIKCLLYVKIISILEYNEEDFSTICEKLNQTWSELEKSVYKIELGFEIVYHAAFLKSKDFAKKTMSAVKEEKAKPDVLLDSPDTTEIFGLAIELAVRVFTGLILKNNYVQKDIENIEKLIGSLPSERQQMNLWTSLILRIIPKSKDDKLPKQLINTYIIPKLSKIKNKNERINAIIDAIIVLYFDNKNIPNIEELPNQKLKDIAISRICNYLFTKCLPDDLCDNEFDEYGIDHDTVEKILELVSLMQNDYFIASQVIEIRRTILSKETKISSQKRADIKTEFEELANSKLPDANNIKHDGYKILVNANALAIKLKQTWEEWDLILKEVENIPNLSDRIYMWDSIAELLPNEFMKQKKELISKAIVNAYKLPSFLDTVERIGMIVFTLSKKRIESVDLKDLFESFIKAINNNPHSISQKENYKNILDVAHSTDPEIAKALVNSFDKDTARLNTGAYLGNHLNLLEFQSKINEKLRQNESDQILI